MLVRGWFRRIFVVALLCLPVSAHADLLVRGKSCYTYGDSESVKTAREIVHSLALRNALESSGIHLSSESEIRNFSLTDDRIKVISSGTMKNIQVVEHTEEGRKICETVEATFEPGPERGSSGTAGPADPRKNTPNSPDRLLTSEFGSDEEKGGGIGPGFAGTRQSPEYRSEEKRICASLRPGRAEKGSRNITQPGEARSSFVRILNAWQELHLITLKTECLQGTDRNPRGAHRENRVGITYCTPDGRVEDLWLFPCGTKGEIRFFQFQMPEQATFYRYWVGP